MITLDINTNYSDRGGGIKTYHQAKIAWFNRQREHRYYLIVPGPKHGVRRLGPRAVRIEVFGPSVGSGYRFLLDFWRVLRIIRRLQPAHVEAGDPLLTGLFCLAIYRFGLMRGRLTAFYHSDPIETWVVPCSRRPGARGLRRVVARLAGRLFYAAQRRYPATIVTSRAMEEHLRSNGVERLVRKPLGADPVFFAPTLAPQPTASLVNCASRSPGGKSTVRLLFVGRLTPDKAADLLLATLGRIMQLEGVTLTVLGGGPLEQEFARAAYPGLRFLGYVGDRRRLAEIYREHQVLLAPGPYETFGLAVLEAMASGLAVVGPDRGGTAELLDEVESPFVFRAGNADDFVRAVQAAVEANLAPHAVAAQAAARRYGTWDEAIGRLMSYYEESASGRIPRTAVRRTGREPAPTLRLSDRLGARKSVDSTAR
jgi:alpha-1,6-mannosyltransferase